jgi:hypothetical protein
MARIAIVGVGAIGGVTAALLQQAGGHELLLCTRRPMSEFSVDTPDGLANVQATFVTSPSEAFEVDWVIVSTKAYDVAGARGSAAKRSRASRAFRPLRTYGEDPAGDGGLSGRAAGPGPGSAARSDAFEGAGQRIGARLREAVCGNGG